MADELSMRSCGRAGCRWPAAASLSFRYASRQVWLLDLSPEPDPSLYDLCPHHADALTVPRGWERVDERSPAAVVAEPAGRDLDPAEGGTPPGAGGYGRNRYAALIAALPRLAREVHGGPPPGEVSPPVPSRELAPLPADAGLPPADAGRSRGDAGAAPAGGGPQPAQTPTLFDARAGDPAVVTDPEPDGDGGVVVPLDAQARRRG